MNNLSNCYEQCDYYYYFDNDYDFHCTNNFSCPKEYPILENGRVECVKYDLTGLMQNFLLNNEINITEKSKTEEIKYYDNILYLIENEFTSENYDTINLDNGQDDIL